MKIVLREVYLCWEGSKWTRDTFTLIPAISPTYFTFLMDFNRFEREQDSKIRSSGVPRPITETSPHLKGYPVEFPLQQSPKGSDDIT